MLRLVIALGLCVLSGASFAAQLKLSDYLNQVKSANDGFKASQISSEASVDKASDSEAVYQPMAFALVQKAQDKKELVPVGQRGTQSDLMIYQGGISKLTEWGTAGKIYYTSSNTSLKGTASQFVPEPSWYEAGLTVEVSQPLLKNSLGSDLKRSVELQRKQSEVVGLSEGLKRKLTLTEAEGIYWRLAIARESVRYARENIGRSKRIVEWNRSRVNRELADAAELIQSEALQQVRDIELTMALDEERAASHAFNTVRGSSETVVQEELTTISKDILSAIPTPSRQGEREDVRVAATLEAISDLGLSLADSKYDPSLDLFASGSFNGRDDQSRMTSVVETRNPKYMSWSVGLKLSAPIAGDMVSRMRGGWAKEKASASLNLQRKRFENEREWLDLNRKLEESKTRLHLVELIESTQKRKLVAERDRQTKGRSTMFQVTLFESDYAQSQLNVVRNKAEILGIIARMKTFGGEG